MNKYMVITKIIKGQYEEIFWEDISRHLLSKFIYLIYLKCLDFVEILDKIFWEDKSVFPEDFI